MDRDGVAPPPGIRTCRIRSAPVVCRWEGNTLVVDTTNFSSTSYFMGSTQNLHLPWTAVIHLKPRDQIYEYACHEGNYDIMIDMLAAAKVGR
jgi:hypothetical protein